ncbi:nucleoredoxin-like [Maniola hyperantus]|uniref:nucleoredoxin-like n=1 Tax=Aphantopus hyperantus TaxID=2795564 RepID=UPI001567D8F2|nr:nucleoredoxin-like [Maniola hyperantus]
MDLKKKRITSKMDWREKLFGRVLVKCDSPGTQNGKFENVPTLGALADCVEDGEGAVCGIYFSFANISDTSDDFGVRLEEVYKRVYPRLKVVEVVLWAHVGTPEGPVEREAGFRRSLTGKPWFAVPFHDVDTKRRLTQKYSIAVGVPTLVIRGRAVRDALLKDPKGERFPWPAPPLDEVLRGVELEGEEKRKYEDLPPDAVRVFYFAAHWCPPCRSFSPSLCAALSAVRKRRAKYANTQLIVVSSDRSEQSYARTLASLSSANALAIPWSASDARLTLPTALGVAGIPALVITDANGKVLTANGRQHLAADPLGLNFPWAQRPVSVLNEQALLKMARHPAVVLFIDDEDSEIEFSESVLTPSAESYYEECSIQYPGFCPYQNSSDDETMDFDYTTTKTSSRTRKKSFKHVMFYIGVDGTDSADMIREHIGLDDAVPLLTAIDFPKQRMVTMKYGDEITTDSVQNFVDAFLSGNADFKPLKPYSEKC